MDTQTDLKNEIIQRYADCPLHHDDALKVISESDPPGNASREWRERLIYARLDGMYPKTNPKAF